MSDARTSGKSIVMRVPSSSDSPAGKRHITDADRRLRNKSLVDSRDIRNAVLRKDRRKQVRSWDALEDVAGEDLRSLHSFVSKNGKKHSKLGVSVALSRSDGGLQDSLRQSSFGWEDVRSTSIYSLSSGSGSTACASSTPSIFSARSNTDETSDDDDSSDTISIGGPLSEDRRISSSALLLGDEDRRSESTIWGLRESQNSYMSPPPFDEDEEDDEPSSAPKLQLRDEDSCFDGVTSTQMEKMQYLQFQQQRLREQQANLQIASESLETFDAPPPAHEDEELPGYNEELPSYNSISAEEGWEARRKALAEYEGYIEF